MIIHDKSYSSSIIVMGAKFGHNANEIDMLGSNLDCNVNWTFNSLHHFFSKTTN